MDVGDPVTAEQMRALFGCGLHPLAELRLQQLEGPDLTGQGFRDVMRLGAPFKIIDDATPFRVEVARRIAALNALIGEPVDARSRRLIGRGFGRRWPGSSLLLSMAGRRLMLPSWLPRSQRAHVPGRRQSPAMT